MLSEPGVDYEGGEFVLLEQRPRAQSRAHVLQPAARRVRDLPDPRAARTPGAARLPPGRPAPRREHGHRGQPHRARDHLPRRALTLTRRSTVQHQLGASIGTLALRRPLGPLHARDREASPALRFPGRGGPLDDARHDAARPSRQRPRQLDEYFARHARARSSCRSTSPARRSSAGSGRRSSRSRTGPPSRTPSWRARSAGPTRARRRRRGGPHAGADRRAVPPRARRRRRAHRLRRRAAAQAGASRPGAPRRGRPAARAGVGVPAARAVVSLLERVDDGVALAAGDQPAVDGKRAAPATERDGEAPQNSGSPRPGVDGARDEQHDQRCRRSP